MQMLLPDPNDYLFPDSDLERYETLQDLAKENIVQTNITPIRSEFTGNSNNLFDSPEHLFKQTLERRAKNHKAFLALIKNHLTEGVDYCNLPVKGKNALPTLLKGGGEVICQILGLIPKIDIIENDETGLTVCCQLFDELDRPISQGFGARQYKADASNGGKNKSVKMAVKSAYLDSVIRAGALSSLFTLDLDDMQEKSNTITIEQIEQLQRLLTEHQIDKTRFMNWLTKFCLSKHQPAVSELKQLPVALFSEVIEKIPTFVTKTH